MKNSLKIIAFIFLGVTFFSCNKNDETNISSYNGNESHNMGKNCMECHKKGGKGEGRFNAAGTAYDSLGVNTYPNTTVKLYTEPNGGGILKHTIQVDALGNFYTTETIEFGSGLYPSITSKNSVKYMSSKITNGQCNSCHGVSTSRIWVK